MKPMLAHKLNDHRKKVKFPCIVQPKLNGVRAIYSEGMFQSRDEHFWKPEVLLHLRYALIDVPKSYILDGELYVHGWSLQRINGAASVNRIEPRKDTFQVQYHIFDIINRDEPSLTMLQRWELLQALREVVGEKVEIVPTSICNSMYDMDCFFKMWTLHGFEGLMYRAIDAPYGFASDCRNKENRWPTLLKRKDWMDDWFPVVDIQEGNGNYEGQVGALVCELADGQRFTVGGGLSDLQRVEFMRCPPSEIHVKYEMLSESGIPLKPTFIE